MAYGFCTVSSTSPQEPSVPRSTRLLVPVVAAVLALTVSGCGVASKALSAATAAASSAAAQANVPSAQDLWTSTQASMKAATSARVKGTVTAGSSQVTVEISGNRDGSNSKMTSTAGGGLGEVLTIGASQYVKGDAAFWKQAGVSSDVIAKIGTKYVKTATSTDNGAISVGDTLDSMASASFNLVDIVNLKVDKVDLNGTAAYLISERVASTEQLKMWISADGASNLVKVSAAGGAPLELSFSDWNAVAAFTAPPADQVIAT
jgi:hypothetical protein